MDDPDRAGYPARFLAEHAHYADDLAFWRALAGALGGPVLDLGTAAGRLALPLARDGHEVWALDADPGMVDEVERRRRAEPADVAARLHPVVGDMRDPAPPGPFRLVLLAMNTLQVLLSPADQLACLRAARDRLAPGGEVAFDVVLPDVGEIQGTLGVMRSTGVHVDRISGATLFHSACYEAFDPVTQTLEFRIMVDERAPDGTLARHVRPHRVHLFMPAELGHLLARAGLEVVEAYGDFEGGPVEPASERQVYRCRAAEVAP